jgi:hypothetical protein
MEAIDPRRVALRDGNEALLRPIDPPDHDALFAIFERVVADKEGGRRHRRSRPTSSHASGSTRPAW